MIVIAYNNILHYYRAFTKYDEIFWYTKALENNLSISGLECKHENIRN